METEDPNIIKATILDDFRNQFKNPEADRPQFSANRLRKLNEAPVQS